MTDAGPTSEPPFDAGALRVAYHEAGHATVARLLDIDIATVTVIAADGALGHVKHNGLADYASLASDPDALMTQIAFERTAMMFLAGCMAERIYLAVSDGELEGYEGALEDLHGATSLIESLTQDGSEELLEAWLHLLDLRVGRLLRTNWSAVQRVAMTLIKRKTLTGAQVDECIMEALTPSNSIR
jgi:hypothetical protein